MSENPSPKDDLRRRLRERRAAVSSLLRDEASRQSAAHLPLLPAWPDCRRVAVYKPSAEEFETSAIVARARGEGMAIYLPVIEPGARLTFALWCEDDSLVQNRFGLAEPGPDAPRIALAELDVIFLPVVGWDRRGGRLGMGGGYYDRTLEGQSGATLVGLAYASQECDDIPRETWDVPLDFVLTERELVAARPA